MTTTHAGPFLLKQGTDRFGTPRFFGPFDTADDAKAFTRQHRLFGLTLHPLHTTFPT